MTDNNNRIEFDEEHVPSLDEAAVMIMEEVLYSKDATKYIISKLARLW